MSTIGGTVADPKADGEGNINVINAAMQAGVKKFILITSIGTGDSKDAPSEEVYNVLRPVLVEKEKAENALMVRDSLAWCLCAHDAACIERNLQITAAQLSSVHVCMARHTWSVQPVVAAASLQAVHTLESANAELHCAHSALVCGNG